MIEFKVKNEVSSFLPDKKGWRLTFSNELHGNVRMIEEVCFTVDYVRVFDFD